MPFLEVRQVRTYYRQTGSGPDLLLIHGIGGNVASWYLSGIVALAAPAFRVTALDLRGHGNSQTPPRGYTSREIAEDVLALMDRLDLGPATLLGHSFGAVVAAQAALWQPDRVSGLILSEAYFPGLADLQEKPNEWPGWRSYQRRAAELGIHVADDWLNLEYLFQQLKALSAKEARQLEALIGTGTLVRLRRLADTTCGVDVGSAAGLDRTKILKLSQPVECVYGEYSPFLPTCQYLASHLARCSYRLIPGVEHFAFDEDPEAFQQVIVQSLSALTGRSLGPLSSVFEGKLIRRKETVMTLNQDPRNEIDGPRDSV